MNARIHSLLKEISKLSRMFLPSPNPTGRYSDYEIACMLAFRILSYAEIESILEEWASELLNDLATRNKAGLLSRRIQRRILLHMDMVIKYPPRSLTPSLVADPQKKISGFLAHHSSVIGANNGASEKDVIKMFVPLGVDLHSFDSRWLTSLRDLSTARGAVAHNPWMNVGIEESPTPEGERQRLVDPIIGLRTLKNHIESV